MLADAAAIAAILERPRESVDDPRVSAVLAVLRGSSISDTAARWSVDPAVLQRWVNTFVVAGASVVTNRPDPQVALQRERFLDAFTHEIREPLAAARRTATLLTDGDGPGADPVGTARRVEGELSRLVDRVQGVELLLGAALGGLEVTRRWTTVGALCRDLPGLGIVRGRGADFEVEVDAGLMTRVLADLWAAAGREPRPTARQLWVRTVGPAVELRVLRQGEPIDPTVLHRLFEPFGHGHLATGVTMGLYLARSLVVAHGGTVGVDQDDSGAGFWVRLPTQHDSSAPRRHLERKHR